MCVEFQVTRLAKKNLRVQKIGKRIPRIDMARFFRSYRLIALIEYLVGDVRWYANLDSLLEYC
jgi:hypothetical protein